MTRHTNKRLLGGLLLLAAALVPIPTWSAEAPGLETVGDDASAVNHSGLSPHELDRVAEWMAKRIIQTGNPAFDDDEGRLIEKLVGQKSRQEVLASLSANFETKVEVAAR